MYDSLTRYGECLYWQVWATQTARLGGHVHVQVDLGGDGREVGTGKTWRLVEARWPARDLWAEPTGRETPGLVKWSGNMNLEASSTDHLSKVKWLPRNWGKEGRSLAWTNSLGGVIKATLGKYFKTYPCLFNSSFLSIIRSWVRPRKEIQLHLGRSNYELYHLRIPKFSSSSFFSGGSTPELF